MTLASQVLRAPGVPLLLPSSCAASFQSFTFCAGFPCQSACCGALCRSAARDVAVSVGGPLRQGVLERLAAAVGVPLGGPEGGSGCGSRAVADAVVGSGRHRQLLQAAIGGIVRASSRRQARRTARTILRTCPVCVSTRCCSARLAGTAAAAGRQAWRQPCAAAPRARCAVGRSAVSRACAGSHQKATGAPLW